MYKRINLEQFIEEFKVCGRGTQLSRQALEKLYSYYEEMWEDCGIEIELDVIALFCEWSEEPLIDVLKNYNLETTEQLENNTTVIRIDAVTILYQPY